LRLEIVGDLTSGVRSGDDFADIGVSSARRHRAQQHTLPPTMKAVKQIV
jgi:hypothetical protein